MKTQFQIHLVASAQRICEEKVGDIDCYKYTADETFEYSSDSVLALKANFDGFLPEGVVGTSYGEMQYKEVRPNILWV